MGNEIWQLGVGWFIYDMLHWITNRPMHTGVVVETNNKMYLLHACGTKVWFQGLKAHLRYRLYVGYDIQIQPLKWKQPKKMQDKIDKFLRLHVDKPYRHQMNVAFLPEVPAHDSEKGKTMREEAWLFPFGQHENYSMSY